MNQTDLEQMSGKIARQVFVVTKWTLFEQGQVMTTKQEKELSSYFLDTIRSANEAAKKEFKKCGIKPKDRLPEQRGPKPK